MKFDLEELVVIKETGEVGSVIYREIENDKSLYVVSYFMNGQSFCEEFEENELKKREARRRNRGRKKMTEQEIQVLKSLKLFNLKWLARNKDDVLCAYNLKPIKNTFAYNALDLSYYLNKDLFKFVTWLDEEATSVEELLCGLQ